MRRALLVSALIWLAPGTVAAQPAGPMTVERIHSGFLAAPEVKVTEVDHKTSELVGGFAGWNYDDTFLGGVGGYWPANRTHNDPALGHAPLLSRLPPHAHRPPPR